MIGDERDSFLLWDLIVSDDDVCFKHILPRLNATDVKFLYEVNSETRKLIKRSSRAGDLKKKFRSPERCRRYRLWKLRGSIFRGVVGSRVEDEMDETYFLLESCSNE